MLIGKAGQRRRFFLTGVLYVQMSWRSRRRGDENMICRHRRHTCANLCHSNTGRTRIHPELLSVRQKSNISSRISSGSELIVNECRRLLPNSPHTTQLSTRCTGEMGKPYDVPAADNFPHAPRKLSGNSLIPNPLKGLCVSVRVASETE